MKCFPDAMRNRHAGRRAPTLLVSATLICAACAWLAHAKLISWSADTIAGSAVETALFRSMPLPGGAVLARRPPFESVPALGDLIKRSPDRTDLYAIRAEEQERQLNFSQAEADWKKAAELTAGKTSAFVDLADFYHRRLEPAEEVSTLLVAAKSPSAGLDRYRLDIAQLSWKLFERAVAVVDESALPPATRNAVYQAWIGRYSNSPEPYRIYLHALIAQKDTAAARALVAQIRSKFPKNEELQLETEGLLANVGGGGVAAELDVYSRRFSPLWAAALQKHYYELLSRNHQLRAFLADAHGKISADPLALDPVLRVFFYYEEASNRPAADNELLAWQSRRSAAHRLPTSPELLIIAPLFARVADYDESSRAYYSAYEAAASTTAEKQHALSELISLLLEVPEQSFALGRRDLSLYRNIAGIDRHPGFLNGILSLALNSTGPAYEYETVSQTANTYFHRAAGARFLDTFKQQFPAAAESASLEAKLFAAYSAYGQNTALIQLVPGWLTHNVSSPAFVNTALLLADAYGATRQTQSEFALYDRLLAAEAAKSDHVPLGPGVVEKVAVRSPASSVDESVASASPPEAAPVPLARSADYARVLDRYIARLTENHRLREALALYRKEIDRNPDDPGLYARLALFIEQNRLDGDLAAVYESAFKRFNEISWRDKLARFYLRRKQYSAYTALTRQITQTFDGSEVALFLTRVSPNANLSPVLYRQINVYAHARFPHNLTFVRNLLRAYTAKSTADPLAYEKLLRENWFYDSNLRTTFFEYLSRSGKLATELAALPSLDEAVSTRNTAAVQMRAEGSAWLTHFEDSSPAFVRLAQSAAGDRLPNERAVSLERSLAAIDPRALPGAVALAETAVKASPRNAEYLVRVGEIYADRDDFAQAAVWWNRIPAVNRGRPAGYLQTATLFWDYFRYDQALSAISDSRRTFHRPDEYAYEAGAICENQGNFPAAIDQYVLASLQDPPNAGDNLARSRLITLAKRNATAKFVEQQTADLLSRQFTSTALQLRVDLLDAQARREEIHSLLDSALPRATQIPDLQQIGQLADRFGFDDTKLRSLERVVSLTPDPVEKLRARLDVALFRESHNDMPGAERDLNTLLTENPMLLGVIRANVDFYWRVKQYGKSVATLEAASSRAQSPYRNELRREAAGKAIDSGEYDYARRLLAPLVAADPFNGDLLSQLAATYSHAGDSAGLVQFYGKELATINAAPLSPGDKADRVAGLRRGYIQALITVKQFEPALTQYELLLNQFPEDDALPHEIARFASHHGSADSLMAYYTKAQSDSPRNYRWPLILARLNAALARFPEALTAYTKAVEVRPDRVDIFLAKADLENRLLRFNDADKTYARVYDLSYHDPQYLVQRAAIQMRLGNESEAVRLLRASYIDPRPHEISGFVPVLRQLASWHMFTAVDTLGKELVSLAAGQDAGQIVEASLIEAQALASLHRPEDAVTASNSTLSQAAPESRDASALARFSSAIGMAAKEYLTPEEKTRFAAFISHGLPAGSKIRPVELADASGLEQLSVDLMAKQLNAKPDARWTMLMQKQSARLQFAQLGRVLENLRTKEEELRDQLLRSAFEAYGKAGDSAGQLRVADALLNQQQSYIDLPQYASLFIDAGPNLPARLAVLAKRRSEPANAVVQRILATAPFTAAMDAIRARGEALSPGWISAYQALAGLYFESPDPATPASFAAVLGPRTVGAQLTSTATQAVKGSTWFYYAARFGDYLGYVKQPESTDLLPATAESSPVASNSYVIVGDTYREMGSYPDAIARYEDALQLSPTRADVHDRIAITHFQAGQKDAALEQWREALRLLADRVEQGPLPPDYWTTAQTVLAHLNASHSFEALSSAVDSLLLAYAKRNGSYNFAPFIEGLLSDAQDNRRALDLVLSVARQANLDDLAEQILNSPLIKTSDKDGIYRFQITRLKARFTAASGEQARLLGDQLRQSQTAYADYLLTEHRWQDAWAVLNEIEPEASRPSVPLIRASAHTGRLQPLLDGYRAQPDSVPPGDQLLAAASALAEDGSQDLAIVLRDFEYERQLDAPDPPAAAYFGMAEVRLAQKKTAEALELVRIASIIAGQPFQNLPESIRFLEKAGLKQDAARYAQQWKTAEPWNPEAQLTSARLEEKADALNALRTSPASPYSVRVAAAAELRKLGKPASGTDELSLLTHSSLSVAEASQPYFVPARILAARSARPTPEGEKLLRDAIATDPSLQAERLDLSRIALERKQTPFGIAVLESYSSTGSPEIVKLEAVQELAAQAQFGMQNFSSALALCDQILAAGPDEATRVRIQKLRALADVQNRLVLLNASRQPVISNELSQAVIVKPKLASLPPGGLQ